MIIEISYLPGYGVSPDGKVWTKRSRNWHKDMQGNIIYHTLSDWTELKPGKNSRGYYTISTCYNKIKKSFKVHKLIAECFIGPIPSKYVVNHINNNPLDNRVENLEIITQKENVHKYLELKKSQYNINYS